MMKVSIAEGYCCKDSQGYTRHVTETVNLHPIIIESDDEGFENIKAERRQDFRFKKKNKSKDKVRKYKIKPHSSGSVFSELFAKLKTLDPGASADICENIILAILLKMRTSTVERALIILSKLLKTHLGLTASSILDKLLKAKNLIGFKSIFKWTLVDVEQYFKELLTNWKIASKNEAFGSIIALFSTIAAVFFGADKKWSFTLGSFSLFMIDARNSCKGATSLVDALLKVVTYIIGGLKTYTTSGSLASFLYADDQLAEFDSTVSKLKATMSMLQPGNLQRCADTDENAFDKDLQLAITSGEKLIALYDGNTKKYVMDKVRLLRQLHTDFIQFRAAGGLRVAPFAYLLSGSTGLGKSSLNEILMRYILAENGYNHTDPYICTLNSQDKFFSTYRSYINGIIFDDFANVRDDFVEESPCETLLKFVNNIPFYLNMAELELKGKVVAEPKVVGITTNVADIDSSVYSNQASSIMRRMKVHIYAKVKKEFAKEGTIEIDPTKVYEAFGDALAPDIWLFDVYNVKVKAIERPPKVDYADITSHRDDMWRMEFALLNGVEMRECTISELLIYIKKVSNIHFREQTHLVERSKLFNGDIVCSDCRAFSEHCTCIREEEVDATINELENIVVDGELFHQDDVIPHSLPGSLYDDIYNVRQTKLQKGLKDMLLSWLVEGKCNLTKFTESLFQNCGEELQYLIIVFRTICEKWFKKNKEKIIEMFFPYDLDDTKAGDYFTMVVRNEKYNLVSSVSCIYSFMAHYGIMKLSMAACRKSLFVGFALPIVGHYLVNRIDIPHYVVKLLNKLEWVVSKARNGKKVKEILTYVIFPMLSIYFNRVTDPRLRMLAQFTSCSSMSAVLLLRSYDKIWRVKSPRALSVYYKSQKQDLNSEWQLIAPAALTMASLYYKKDDIMDFYTEAWETWVAEPHSLLAPNVEEIEKRDKKHRFDSEWFNTQTESFLDPLPTSKPVTSDELRNNVQENTWYAKNLVSGMQSNCFVLCSGCILIPWHFVPKEVSKFLFVKHNRGNTGNKQFISVIDPSQCLRVGTLDLAMMWQPKTRDVKNLIEFFPLSVHNTYQDRTGSVFTRNSEGDLIHDGVIEFTYSLKATSGLGYTFPGASYFWKGAKEGTCMSPIITDDKKACISCFHIGGSTKARSDGCYLGFGVSPTQELLLSTKQKLDQMPSIIPMSAPGQFHKEVMGVKVLQRCIKKKSCYLRMKAYNCAQFLGSSYNCNRTPRSAVRDTPIKAKVKKIFDLDLEWGSPMFKGLDNRSPYEPWEVGMEKWVVDRPGVPFGLLNRSKIEYTNALTRVLYENHSYWKSEIRVLSWDEVVNGIPGKRFIDSMNFKSSIGFPFKGSKKLFSQNLGNTGEGWNDKRVLNPEFIEEAERIIELYERGQRYYPWFTTTLKDEPTLVGKSKVRVFQASSTPFQLVVRKYTLGICRFLQMNPLVSECAVGIDPCSSEWNELYTHLNGMQTYLFNRWFAIDYKVYDTSISSQLIMCIGRIFSDLARSLGYADNHIAVLHSIFTELSFSIVDFNGDVLMLDGANPSGNPLTVFINNITNSLLMRIYFYHLYPTCNFRDHVRMMGYGDDLIASIRATVGYFNMVGYAEYMKEFGFLVTPAVKDAKLTKYVGVEEVDFLKRKFVWNADYGAVIAPLEEASIYKRLCNYMSSDTDVNIIVGANIDGALDEWAFYGKQVYLDKQSKLQTIVDEFRLHRFVSRLYMTYEQRIVLWKEHNADPAVMGKGRSMDTKEENCDNSSLGFFGWGNIIPKIRIGGPPISHNSGSFSSNDSTSINEWTNEIIIDGNVEPISPLSVGEPKPYEWDIFPHSVMGMSIVRNTLSNAHTEITNVEFGDGSIFLIPQEMDDDASEDLTPDESDVDSVGWEAIENAAREESFLRDQAMERMIDAFNEHEALMNEVLEFGNYRIVPHSTDRHQLMGIDDAEEDQVCSIPYSIDPTRSSRDTSMSSLGEFLGRPVQIWSGFWSPSIQFSLDINPWWDFMRNKRVVNRINNFKLYRGRLKVKILINGNGFYYGRLMASYIPFYHTLDKMTSSSPVPLDHIQMSQFPRIFIDPTTSTGGTMEFPFFWHKDYLELEEASLRELGSLVIRELTSLKHTSGDNTVGTKVSVNIFAWMEDSHLDAPTQANLGFIVPQSTKDERVSEMGPISKMATALENIAIEGSKAPMLAPFCVPAQIGAKMIRAGASTYGWSSPSIIEEVKPFVPRGIGNTSVMNGPDTALKMTSDLKQEVSVDPRILGLGSIDELDIKYIAGRESYITSFFWKLSDEPKDMIFNLRVDPCHWNEDGTPGNPLAFTASCGATLPFRYWTGTFKLRLQIVSSAFHRGRLIVVYDPNSTKVPYEENVAYSQVIDIATNKDVVFKVGPNQSTTLMGHAVPGITPIGEMLAGVSALGAVGFGNGVISVNVLNELTIPNAASTVNNDIQVNVFVSMDDDFEVFVPDDRFSEYTIKPNSGIADPVMMPTNVGGDNEDKQMDLDNNLDSHLSLVYSGEQIKSFRTMLKRYYPHGAIYSLAWPTANNFAIDRFTHPMFPLYRGKVTDAVHLAAGAPPFAYNYFCTTLLNYLAPAFSARRGSTRWKLVPKVRYASGASNSTKYVFLNHEADYSRNGYGYTGTVAQLSDSTVSFDLLSSGSVRKTNGTVLFSSRVNPNCEYEIPFYSNYRFVPGKLISQIGTELNGNVSKTGVTVEIDRDNNNTGRIYQTYVSAGEDFSFYFFTGWPRMYRVTSSPGPFLAP